MNMPQNAVVIRDAHKSYSKKRDVLNGLHMTVPRGCIYGLLGASGCGKTTLLSCVVGIQKLDTGSIWVLGGVPGIKGSGIPGTRVGYMPQEISLVKEFTVIGAFYYFGRINGLEDCDIDERYKIFSNILLLPPKNRLIKYCSGGQQRRVSFAAALLHRPELLILDEPTVGLDPIIRHNLWNFLVKLTIEEGTAIIITTHYIEEAKLANKVGLMRHGQLLAETTPQALLTQFQCTNLEKAFLILTQQQEDSKKNKRKGISNEIENGIEDVRMESSSHKVLQSSTDYKTIDEKQLLDHKRIKKSNKESLQYSSFISRKILKALMAKNFLQFLRHPGGILFAFAFPIVQVSLFFYAVGQDPKGLIMAIVNDEAGNCNNGQYLGSVYLNPDTYDCEYIDISCRFLNGFNETLFIKQFYQSVKEATIAVTHGRAAGIIYFPRNFSKSLQMRQENIHLSKQEVFYGNIHTTLDMGDRQVGLFLKKGIVEHFFKMYSAIVTACDIPRKYAEMPIKFEDPIFGSTDLKYSDFMAPGFILTICFFLATAVSSSIIIADRAEGIWDRSLVQGVKTTEILLSHVLTQIIMILIQVSVVLSITFGHFKLDCKGSLLTVIALTLLTGFCGMCYGFLISTWCPSHTLANFISTGSFYPLVLLSGSIWPAEAMPIILQFISYILPTTIPSFALRSILSKGSLFTDQEVYSGFFIILTWSLIFIFCCLYKL